MLGQPIPKIFVSLSGIIFVDSHRIYSVLFVHVLFYRLDNLRGYIVAVELGHHVDARRPALEPLDQLHGQFHAHAGT